MAKTPDKIDPNTIKTRDSLLVEIIKGITKSGPHKDRKKDANRRKCRQPVREDE